MSEAIVGFNYEALEEPIRARTREHAEKIHELNRTATAGIMEIGERLVEVHAALGRGFAAWLKAEFRWSQSVASNFENVARKFGKLKCLDRFNASALYVLARGNTDPRVVKEAMRRAQRGEMISREKVVQIMRKLQPAAAAGESKPGALKRPVTDFRSFLRRFDVTAVPHEDRAELANELLELAMQLRSGRAADGSPIVPKPAQKPAPSAPRRSRPEVRRRSPQTEDLAAAGDIPNAEHLKCA